MTVELSNLHDTVPNCFFKRNVSNCKLSRVKEGYFCRWLSFIYIYKRRRYSSIVLGQFYGGWDDLQLIFKAELLKRYCKANSL
jgi:hypothetical protein